jgi:hypothetical protein
MALRMTAAGESALLQFITQGTTGSPTSPGGWITFFTTGPSSSGSGDVELTGYTRISATSWSLSGAWPARTATLAGTYTFTMPTCTITGWGLSNDASGGTLLCYELFAVPVSFTAGELYRLSPGDVTLPMYTN